MNLIKQHWDAIKQAVRTEDDTTDIAYNVWIEPLRYFKCEGSNVTILIPDDNPQKLEYITKNYQNYFQKVISDLMGSHYTVDFQLQNAEDDTVTSSSAEEVSGFRSTNPSDTRLNKKYRFDTFIPGSNSEIACNACMHVAEKPGSDFNPLFIYGGSGLGKTHLMISIGHYIIEHSNLKVLYVTSEEFTTEVTNSIRNGSASAMNTLRDKYRNIDVLLIDDIQFIIGRQATQVEFFNTFNTLIDHGKAVVITSDKHPSHMKDLEERFRTRFNSGLTVDIQPPVYETRVAILEKYSENYEYKVPHEIIEYIAKSIKSNVRELEGAYNKVYAEGVVKRNITLEDAKTILKELISMENPTEITHSLILEAVSNYYGIPQGDITSKKRNAEIVLPRQVFMYLCRDMTDITLKGIAALLNKKDHATVLHGCNKIEDEITTNEKLREQINAIKTMIKSS